MSYHLRGLGSSWYCSIPGTPVPYWEQLFGCPVDASGLAPIEGGSPSDALVNKIVYHDIAEAKTPPPVGTPVSTAPPESEAEANATIDAVLKQQSDAWKAQNLATMQQTAANLKAQSGCPQSELVQKADGTWSCPLSSNPWIWIALAGGVGILGVAALGSGSPRRYGR